MPRFVEIPPTADVPRPSDNVPEEVTFQPLHDIHPGAHIPADAGPPDGIPMIPIEVCEDLIPEEAEDALDGFCL